MGIHYGVRPSGNFSHLGTTWTPASISTAVWLDASDSATVTQSSNLITAWNDKSGNARHATAFNNPTYIPSGQNSKNLIRCDGTDDYFTINLDWTATGSHSLFTVIKPVTYSNLYGAANGGSGSSSLHVGFSSSSTWRMNYWSHDYGPSVTANFVPGNFNIINFAWPVGSNKKVYANGKLEATGGQIAAAIGVPSGGGRILNVVGQGYMACDICEIIMINSELSDSDRYKMEGYLAHKWGTQSYLDSAHPYKSGPPVSYQ